MAITKTVVLKLEDADAQYRIVRVQDDGAAPVSVIVDLHYETRQKADLDAAGAERWTTVSDDVKREMAEALVRGLDRVVSTRLAGGKARTAPWPEGRFTNASGPYQTAITALSQ